MEENQQHINEQNQLRPEGLKILCILSFIGSGLSLFSHILFFLFYPGFLAFFSNPDLAEVSTAIDTEVLVSFIKATGRTYFFLNSLLYMMSLAGVYLMWNLRKKGIHYYAIAQIFILLIPLIFISGDLAVLPGLILTAMFIYMYSRFLKIMS
ncbi:MAG: hypothetical protein GQ527_06375 [Bacteroidales bacterium]|nr:hypothetical protein [Bacteroidales bacterium]